MAALGRGIYKCSHPGVNWCYPAREFIADEIETDVAIVVSHSAGGWAACETCHQVALASHHVQHTQNVLGQMKSATAIRPETEVGRASNRPGKERRSTRW